MFKGRRIGYVIFGGFAALCFLFIPIRFAFPYEDMNFVGWPVVLGSLSLAVVVFWFIIGIGQKEVANVRAEGNKQLLVAVRFRVRYIVALGVSLVCWVLTFTFAGSPSPGLNEAFGVPLFIAVVALVYVLVAVSRERRKKDRAMKQITQSSQAAKATNTKRQGTEDYQKQVEAIMRQRRIDAQTGSQKSNEMLFLNQGKVIRHHYLGAKKNIFTCQNVKLYSLSQTPAVVP